MPWSNNGGGRGGGPWGQPPGGGNNPWGGRPGGGGGGGGGPRRPGGGGPDLEEVLRKGQDRMKQFLPRGLGGAGLGLLILVLIGVWLLTGLYRVNEGERGVPLVFGNAQTATLPGLRYNWPAPIGQVITVPVEVNNRIPIGYSETAARRGGQSTSSPVPAEALMVTQDENIVDIRFDVIWRVADPINFLFQLRDPAGTAKTAAESVMREVIARTNLDTAITEGRAEVASQVMTQLQDLLDSYKSGISILNVEIKEAEPPQQVIDAFRDVVAASNDRATRINEATRYQNEVVPRARGDAQRLIEEANAYSAQQVARARGDADRFLQVYEAFNESRTVTAQRLYLETMEEVLRNANKYVLDSENSGGVLPYLPLDRLQSGQGGQR